ncbi:MAG: RdgB/HAM1 family non-canonical purine NTP pyrophosphatase [Candidatus Methylacidiphilales bacterium]|nr:RdgB/HAM1 family non-canonical purine NTP pyrophosphatase [Candidatus Methylacidiphilales bacterium]
MQTILIATGNRGKAREFQEMIGHAWRVLTLRDLPEAPTVEEDGATFEANACKKALALVPHFDGPILADDSGLEVDALGGAPGVFSARYAGVHGDDAANNRKLMEAMRDVPEAARGAQFHCVLAWVEGGIVRGTYEGICRGRILREGRGTNGFGYDPLFQPEGFLHTMAELDPGEKHALSHRGKAMRLAVEALNKK